MVQLVMGILAGGGHSRALPLQAPTQAQPAVPGRLPAGYQHSEGHSRLHCGRPHSAAAFPGETPCTMTMQRKHQQGTQKSRPMRVHIHLKMTGLLGTSSQAGKQ